MVVQFSVLVANNDDLIGLGYTTIEIWQSVDQGNSYQELTAPTPQSAYVESLPAQTTFQMGGHLLKVVVNGGAEQSISFSPLTQHWTPQQVVDRINEVIPGLASLITPNIVRLTSPTTGRASSIEVTYCDAYDLFPERLSAHGRDARITLALGTTIYQYSDVSGSTSARYRWRFTANGSDPKSDFSPYVLGSTAPLVSPANLSVCQAKFVGLNGQPVKTKLVIVSEQNPSSTNNLIVTSTAPLQLESDDLGFIQFSLVRGTRVKVAIEGTAFVREFTVPDAASFDLLAAMAAAPDPFTVQTVPPFLIRRSV
jgi:hypothetical protein